MKSNFCLKYKISLSIGLCKASQSKGYWLITKVIRLHIKLLVAELVNCSMITALTSLQGYKSYSHECLVAFLEENFSKFTNLEIVLIDQLRVIRNDIGYRGIFVEDEYLIRNETKIKEIIFRLNNLLENI